MSICKVEGLDSPITLEGDYEPRSYQIEDFELAKRLKVSGNWSEVGTGKSLVSYLYVAWHIQQGRKVIVAMPASLTTQYVLGLLDTLEAMTPYVGFLTGNKKKREKALAEYEKLGWPDVIVCGFGQFVMYQNLFNEKGFSVLVVDEAHVLCTLTNKMYVAVAGAIRRKRWCALIMTATPHLSELAKAYGIISLTNPDAYLDFNHFETEHIDYLSIDTGNRAVAIIDNYRAVDLINKNLMTNAVRRRRSEVLSLADPTIINHHISLDEKHEAAVMRVLDAWLLNMTPEKVEYLENPQKARMVALSAIANPEKFTDGIACDWEDEPMQNLRSIQEQLDSKLVVFCYFRDTINKLAKEFAHLNPAIIMGGADNAAQSEKFKNDPTCRIVFAQYKPGGAGHNWQKASCYVVFYEPIADVAMLNQAIGRVDRSGQELPVVVWFFVYNLQITKKLVKKAGERAQLLQQALGDSTNYTQFLRRIK